MVLCIMESVREADLNHVSYRSFWISHIPCRAIFVTVLVTRLVAISVLVHSVVSGFCSLSELRTVCLSHMVLLSTVLE